MGFYGKVNNNNATQFVIDKIYSSRAEMELELKDGDNIFIGRYVLIEYNHALTQLFKTTVEIKEEDNTKKEEIRFYFSRLLNEDSRAKFLPNDKEMIKEEYYKKNYIRENQVIYILDENLQIEYYKCISEDDNGYAIFEKQPEDYSPTEENIYFDNYLKDLLAYPDSRRGYDSTVWQKIYVDESEEYVMIAELNSVVPTFDLTIDAPTEQPRTPHFDADSTNVYYKLHVQPNWGFRVKPDNSAYSTNGEAIYYNADGFIPNKQSHVNRADEISLKPTGISEYSATVGYNAHNENNPFATNKNVKDIQELSIILPSLGNAVSDMWDIIYGYEANGNRTTELGWDKNGTKRLIKEDETGYLFNEGDDIATVAGCINSVHDLMGKIIDNKKGRENGITPSSASIDKIYYGDFRKNPDGKPEYDFYIKDACYTYEEATQESATEITNMTQFEKNKYYYSSDNNYYLETNDYTYGKNYFNINTTEVLDLIDSYESGKYYYLQENNYLLENSDNPDETKTYYEINLDLIDNITDPENHKLFFQGRDQITDENGINKGYCYQDEYGVYRPLTQNSVFNDTYNYYWAEGYEIKRVPSQEEPDNPEKDTVSLIIDKDTDIKYPVIFIEFNESKNYYSIDENNNYIKLLKENIDDNVVYKIFEQDAIKTIEGLFYEPNLYHYSVNGIDYIFGIEPNKVDGVPYYKLNSEEMKVTFYEPNKYYYKDDNGDYIIDTNSTKGNYTYYNYYPLYVIPDKSNSTIFPDGSLWNPNLSIDVAAENNVVLGTRKESWRWKKLTGFARNLNTIHGLIVKINNILKIGDIETRDRNTVQGCINSMNDILRRIDILKPNYFIAVNEYGCMTSMEPKGDNWIDVSVNANKNNAVIINHIGPVAKDARNEDDKKPLFGETFEIEDWVFDDKGHKTNISTHTVKIPQGSLTAAASNGSDVVTQLEFIPATGEIKTIRENLVNLKLADYIKGNDNGDVTNTDTLGGALSKLQTQIIEEENTRANAIAGMTNSLNEAIEKEVADRNAAIKVETDARIAAINALDATITTESAEVITSITQTDGLITAGKKKVGELTLAGWTLGENVANNESIADTDTVNNAFAKAQKQINANKAALAVLNGNSTIPGSVAYQIAKMVINADENASIDKLEEIAAWIVNDTTGAAKMNSDIKANADAIDALELLVGNTAVATQIADAINNALIVDGVNKYVLAADLVNLSTTVSNINSRVEDLELAVSAEKIAQWDAAEVNVQSDWAETDETADSYIKNKPTLDFVPMETYNVLLERIAALEARIEILENPTESVK